MFNVGEWAKIPNGGYVKITSIDIGTTRCMGYHYDGYSRHTTRKEFDLGSLERVSIEDVLESVFDEVLELKDDIRKINESIESIKMDLQ